MTAPLHGHNFGGDWIECTDEHPRAGRSSDPEPAPCCGHDPHGDEPCRGRVTDWGGAKFPCPCDGAVPALQATGEGERHE